MSARVELQPRGRTARRVRRTRRRSPSRPGAAAQRRPARIALDASAARSGAAAACSQTASPSTGSGDAESALGERRPVGASSRGRRRRAARRAAALASPSDLGERLAERRRARRARRVAARVVHWKFAVERVVAAARRQPALDGERRVAPPRRGGATRGRLRRAAGDEKRDGAERVRVAAAGARGNDQRESRRTVSSSTGLSGVGLELRLPDFLRARALALRPQHFAEMRGDFRVGPLGQRAPEVLLRVVEVSQPELRPAHAVEDERIVGRELVARARSARGLRPCASCDRPACSRAH